MARKQLSARITNAGGSPSNNSKAMILSVNNAGGFTVAAANTKFIPANGTVSDSGIVNFTDMSDPTQGLTYAAFKSPVAGTISKAFVTGKLPTLAQTCVLTLMKNGVATTI